MFLAGKNVLENVRVQISKRYRLSVGVVVLVKYVRRTGCKNGDEEIDYHGVNI